MILHEAGSGLPGTGEVARFGRAFARQRLGSVVAGETSEKLDPGASYLPSFELDDEGVLKVPRDRDIERASYCQRTAVVRDAPAIA